MLDGIIEEAIATWKPIEFTREDLNEKRFRVLWWTSLEIEKEINRLSDMWYIPIWGLSCTSTSHWLVYAQLMENLYFNPVANEIQMDSEDFGQESLWSWSDFWDDIYWWDKTESDWTDEWE